LIRDLVEILVHTNIIEGVHHNRLRVAPGRCDLFGNRY
jgi:hypothetical protein